jgi:hypothetical protein
MIVLIEAVGVVSDRIYGPGARRIGPDDRPFAHGNATIAIHPAVEELLVIVQIIGIVINIGAAFHLADSQDLASIYGDSLSRHRLDDDLLAEWAVLRRVHLDIDRITMIEYTLTGQEVLGVRECRRVQHLLAGCAQHARLDDPID